MKARLMARKWDLSEVLGPSKSKIFIPSSTHILAGSWLNIHRIKKQKTLLKMILFSPLCLQRDTKPGNVLSVLRYGYITSLPFETTY